MVTKAPARRKKRTKRPGPKARLVKPREADKPGPDTTRLVIDGDFEQAVRKALRKPVSK